MVVMIEKYEKYLDIINGNIQKFFEQQKPYICCKAGCSICCETGEYPLSELEYQYLMLGYNNLDENIQKVIQLKIEQIKKDKKETFEKNQKKGFMHQCPFLLEKKCSIYKYRPIICRSYGLASYMEDKEGNLSYNMPCCCRLGLNYSSVFDEETKTFSSKKWKETGIEIEPLSYNVGIDFLTDNNITKEIGIVFGEKKALLDWMNLAEMLNG